MRKFGIFILVSFATLVFSQTFGYFEDKVYCDVVDQKNIIIFLKNEEGLSKCKIYLDTIYQLALRKYGEISLVQTYISQGEDIYYRKEVLEEKKSEFLQLVNYRAQIKMAIGEFESSFFERYYEILQKPMQKYYADLETQYYILINQNESTRPADYSIKIAQLEQQMGNVSHVLNATKLDDIMEIVSSYIYLKNQIEGK